MIRCFSGNGNSRKVALELGNEISEDNLNVVWIFPIHAWGVPRAVLRMIAEADDVPERARHWMIGTCGDDAGMADKQWRRAIESRGWETAGAYTVVMPNTYICLPGFKVDCPELEQRKLASMPEAVRAIREDIINSRPRTEIIRGAFPRFKSGPVRKFFERFLMSPKRFKVHSNCTGCGQCVRTCPLGNIKISDGKPHFGTDCTHCLGCLHSCPVNAIEWGPFTKGKQRYRHT